MIQVHSIDINSLDTRLLVPSGVASQPGSQRGAHIQESCVLAIVLMSRRTPPTAS